MAPASPAITRAGIGRRGALGTLAAGTACGLAAGWLSPGWGGIALAAAAAMNDPPPAQLLFEWHGFDEDERRRVFAGEIISRQVPSRREQQMTVASALLLARPLAAIAGRFANPGFYPPDPDLIATGTIGAGADSGADSGADWRGAAFTAADRREIERLLDVEAGWAFNLSASEIAALRRDLAGRTVSDLGAVSAAWRAMLIARAGAYGGQGLPGIAGYDRGGGREQRPDAALRADTAAFDAQFAPYLADLRRSLAGFPQPAADGVRERLSWRKTTIDGRAGFQLLHLLIAGGGGWLATATRQFYVSHSYDSLQAIAVFYDLGERTLLIDLNATTTDRIPPILGALARSLGGAELQRTLGRHFAALRDRLAAAP